ncbi:multiprotein-bridging factor 1 family protein [Capnocytophaga canimorsus]|uniref:multiprotein-bridging factor 1 family protein n=1 Tax=Capnocytophaga canimorsus TaxID=28188 RepID=UPI0037D64115
MGNKELALEKRIKIANIIIHERENKGFSAEYLAEKVGISTDTLLRIENGKFSPDSDLLCVILHHLDSELKINQKRI